MMQWAVTYLLVVCASFLAALGILFPVTWVLAPLGLALFFYTLLVGRSYTGAFFKGLLFGIATGGAGIWWFWGTLPLDWLGLSSPEVGWMLVFLSWWPVTLMFGVVTAVGSLLLFRLRRVPLAALLFAVTWALIEEARMWGFAFLTYADRGFMGGHFSSTAIGYPLAENGYLLQIAAFGGVFALNLATALAAAVIAYLALRDFSVRSLPAAALLTLVLLSPTFAPKPYHADAPLRVALGYADIPVGTIEAPNQFVAMLEEMNRVAPDASLLVLPEERRYNSPFETDAEKRTAYAQLFGERDVLILSSKHKPAEPTGFNIVLWYENGTGDVVGEYSKRFFMPGGEYMPHAMLAVFSFAPDSGLTDFINALPKKAPPRSDLIVVPIGDHRVGGLICSDFLSPTLNSDLAHVHGADVIVNSANPGWFHRSKTLHTKTMQISRVHAVGGRSYYLQASNGAASFAIDPYGRMIAESPVGTGVLPVTLFE